MDFISGPVTTLPPSGAELYVSSGSTGSADTSQTTMITIKDLTKIRDIDEDYRKQQRQSLYTAKYKFQDILHTSAAMSSLVDKAQKIAKSNSSILLMGESGTGKELLAQSIHNASSRSNYPFVAINCAALNENLLESELFGYKEGAFTGARKGGKKGLFELAHLGSIFLDEIGDAPYSIQTKLLRVLQEREIMQVGGEKVIPIDVRVIAATNRDLSALVEEGKFRKDLYYRINILPLYVPPLRERLGDIQILFRFFLNKYAAKQNIPVPVLDRETTAVLLNYHWPGNIRELEHLAEYITIIAPATDNLHQDILNHLTGRDIKVSPPPQSTQATFPAPIFAPALFSSEEIKEDSLKILMVLREYRKKGITLGRGKLKAELEAMGLPLSEQQIKTRLEGLQKMGMVKSIVGKGTVILPQGESHIRSTV